MDIGGINKLLVVIKGGGVLKEGGRWRKMKGERDKEERCIRGGGGGDKKSIGNADLKIMACCVYMHHVGLRDLRNEQSGNHRWCSEEIPGTLIYRVYVMIT